MVSVCGELTYIVHSYGGGGIDLGDIRVSLGGVRCKLVIDLDRDGHVVGWRPYLIGRMLMRLVSLIQITLLYVGASQLQVIVDPGLVFGRVDAIPHHHLGVNHYLVALSVIGGGLLRLYQLRCTVLS